MIFLNSCSKESLKDDLSHQLHEQTGKVIASHNFEHAKNVDISVPLGFSIIRKEEYPSLEYLLLEGIDTLDHVKGFYTAEMERLGWEILDLSTSQETLLVCKNIKKCCVISARSHQDKSEPKLLLHIFIRQRQNLPAIKNNKTIKNSSDLISLIQPSEFFSHKGPHHVPDNA